MNNEILKLIAEADFSSAISEVEKFRKKMTSITKKTGKTMSFGDAGDLTRLYDDFDQLIAKKREFAKAERRGTFREQEKATARLQTAMNNLTEDYEQFEKSMKQGGKTVAKPLLHDLDVLKKDVEELRSKGLGRAVGSRAESVVEKLKTDLQDLPEDTKKWRAQVQNTYEDYTKIKQEQDELISLLKRTEAQEKSITQENKEKEQLLKQKVQYMEDNASVLANRIVPNEYKSIHAVQEINQEYKEMQQEFEERVQEEKEFRNHLIKEGASHEKIEMQNRAILKLQKARKAEENKLSQEMKEQVQYARERNMTGKHTGFLSNLGGLISKFKQLNSAMKKNNATMDINQQEMSESTKEIQRVRQEQTKLGIKMREYNKQVIRQGGRTAGIIRTFSRWRNRILVTTFALAGLVRGMRRMIDMAVKAQKQFIALNKVAENLGISSNRVTKAARQLAADGLVSLKEATQSIKALIATGADVDLVVQNLKAMKDAAIANGRAGYTVGQNLVAYARGVKQMRSQLADAAGVMKNISQILKEHPDWVSKYGKATALLKGFTEEAQRFGGSVAEMLKTLPGQVQQLQGQFKLLQTEIGKALAAFSEQWTAKLLVKVQEARESFEKQEGAVYEWFNTLGAGVADALDAIDNFLPALREFAEAAITLGHAVFGIIDALGWFAKKMGGTLGNLIAFSLQFKILKTAVINVEFWLIKLKKAMVAIEFSKLTGAAKSFGWAINWIGIQIDTVLPWLKMIGLLAAAAAPLVVNLFKGMKERAAEATKRLKENKETWDKIKNSIGEVEDEIQKFAKSLGEQYTTEQAFDDLKDYLITMHKIRDIEKDISGLKERKEILEKWGESGMSMLGVRTGEENVKKYGKIVDNIQDRINKKQKQLNKLRQEEESIMKGIRKLAKDIVEEYKIQDVYKEGNEIYVEFLRLSREGNEVLEKSVKFTWEQFENWIKIRHQIDQSLSGVKALNEDIKKGAREAQDEIRELQREILQIGKHGITGDMLETWVEYSEGVDKAKKNLNDLEKRAEDTEKRLGGISDTFKKYMDRVVDMTKGTDRLERIPDTFKTYMDRVVGMAKGTDRLAKNLSVERVEGLFQGLAEASYPIPIKQRFSQMVTDMISIAEKGESVAEEQIEKLTAFATQAGIRFYQEKDLRSYLNIIKELFKLDKNIADAREKFNKKQKVQQKLMESQYNQFYTERKQGIEDTNKGLKEEREARENNLSYLRKEVQQLRTRTKLISASPYKELVGEQQLQSIEDTIELMKNRNKQEEDLLSLRSEFEEKITETRRRHEGAALAVERLKAKIKEDEEQPALEKAIELQTKIMKQEGKRLDNLKQRKKTAISSLKDEHYWRNMLLELTQEQERHEKAMQNARKMAQLSFWEKQFAYQKRKERYNERDLHGLDKMKARTDDFFDSIAQHAKSLKGAFGAGSFISAGLMSGFEVGGIPGFGNIKIEQLRKKREELENKLSGLEEGTNKYKEKREQLRSIESAIKDHWNNVQQIYAQGTQQVLNILVNYAKKQAQFRQERKTQRAKQNAKWKEMYEQGLMTHDQYVQKEEDYDKYLRDQKKLHTAKMAKYRKQLASDAMISAGTQIASQAIAKMAMALPGPLGLAIGTGLIALGSTMATGPNYGKKVAQISGKISGKKAAGAYGTAFEDVGAGGTTSGTGAESAGGTVSAPPQNININPNIEFNGETIFLTPHGEADVSDIGENLGNSIVSVVQDAIDTGEIEFTA